MRQVPEKNEDDSYFGCLENPRSEEEEEENEDDSYLLVVHNPKSEIEEDPPQQNSCGFIKNIAAFNVEVGNFSNFVFNLLATANILNTISDISEDDSLNDVAKIGCWIFAASFSAITLIHDLLLINPFEFFKKNSEKKSSIKPSYKILDYFILAIIYVSYITTSACAAAGAAGFMDVFPNSIFFQVIEILLGVIGITFGVGYLHLYFKDIINETLLFFKNFFSPRFSRECPSFSLSLQTIKSFSVVSIFYPTMSAFYVKSLIDHLKNDFSFDVSSKTMMTCMGISGFSIFISNIFTRFFRVKQKYFVSSDFYSINKTKEIVSEVLISSAGLVFSISYFNEDYWKIAGAALSTGSLIIGLKSLSERIKRTHIARRKNRRKNRCYIRTATWINGIARLHKSGILLFSAFWKIQDMLKQYADFDLGLRLQDCLCLVFIVGIPIATNNSAINQRKLEKNIKSLILWRNSHNRPLVAAPQELAEKQIASAL